MSNAKQQDGITELFGFSSPRMIVHVDISRVERLDARIVINANGAFVLLYQELRSHEHYNDITNRYLELKQLNTIYEADDIVSFSYVYFVEDVTIGDEEETSDEHLDASLFKQYIVKLKRKE